MGAFAQLAKAGYSEVYSLKWKKPDFALCGVGNPAADVGSFANFIFVPVRCRATWFINEPFPPQAFGQAAWDKMVRFMS